MASTVVDPVHIDVILSTAINGPWDFDGCCCRGWRRPHVGGLDGIAHGPLTKDNATLAGCALLRECVAAVSQYHRGLPVDRLPGIASGFDPEDYEWTDLGRPLSAIECCKAIRHYERQCCLYRDWGTSSARALCEQLRGLLVGGMEGYADAPWEWTREGLERSQMDTSPLNDLS